MNECLVFKGSDRGASSSIVGEEGERVEVFLRAVVCGMLLVDWLRELITGETVTPPRWAGLKLGELSLTLLIMVDSLSAVLYDSVLLEVAVLRVSVVI